MDTVSNLWQFIEPITFFTTIALSLYVFFKDPLRRWIFFGFRPTAVIAIIDPENKKILFVLHRYNHNAWQLPQGGLYTNDVVGTIEGIIKRELGIDSNHLELKDIYKLGTIRIKDRNISAKNFIGLIKITRRIRGKGYFGCIVHANLDTIKENIELGYALKDYKVIDMDKAEEYLNKSTLKKKYPEKYDLVMKVLKFAKRDS